MRPLIVCAVLVAGGACAAPVSMSGDTVSDAQIVALASKAFEPGSEIPATYVMGVHHGAKVVVEFRCGDVCPQYTSRHIHYDVEPGPACDKIGGRTRTESFVQGIGVVRKDFCVPAVLVEKNLD